MSDTLFGVSFDDGSVFVLPKVWEDVFVDYFGPNPALYPDLAERLRWVVGKYVEHEAWPSKFDGIGIEGDEDDDRRYDDPAYYWEHWSDWSETGLAWGDRVIGRPSWADVAEAVMYQSMRSGILQKALQDYAERTGTKPVRVVTPEQLLREIEAERGGGSDGSNG